MIIENLEWDSDFFGIKVGRLIVSDLNSFDAVSFNKQVLSDNYDLVYIVSLKKMLDFEKLSPLNLSLMDIQITMSKKVDITECTDHPYEFRTELSEKELNECYSIVEQTASVSRFFNEPLIGPEKTKKLYRRWVDNAVSTNYADGIIISKNNDKIVGVHIVTTDVNLGIGHCSVIGVSENEKGNGIGRDLWFQALNYWNIRSNVKKYHVPFSIQNLESFNFHLKIGFNKIEEVKYIYHYRKNTL